MKNLWTEADVFALLSCDDRIKLTTAKAIADAHNATLPQSVCTCDNASGLHWGKCPLNLKPQPQSDDTKRLDWLIERFLKFEGAFTFSTREAIDNAMSRRGERKETR